MINRSESQLFARDHRNQTMKSASAAKRKPVSGSRSRSKPARPQK